MCNIRYDWSYLFSALFCVYQSYIILLFKETSPHTILKQSRSPKKKIYCLRYRFLYSRIVCIMKYSIRSCAEIFPISFKYGSHYCWLQKFHDKLSLMDYPITQRTSILEQTLKESKGSTLSFILKTCCACCDSNAEMFILCRQWMNLRSVKQQFAQWSICLYIRTTPVD